MPRTCTICNHENRDAIEEDLITGTAYRNISKRFGVSTAAVYRHKQHVIEAVTEAREARGVARADGLLLQVQELQKQALSILGEAQEAADFRAALAAIREARGCLELLGKLTGELQPGTVNILISPMWAELKAVIIGTLEPFPEVQLELIQRLAEVNSRGRPV